MRFVAWHTDLSRGAIGIEGRPGRTSAKNWSLPEGEATGAAKEHHAADCPLFARFRAISQEAIPVLLHTLRRPVVAAIVAALLPSASGCGAVATHFFGPTPTSPVVAPAPSLARVLQSPTTARRHLYVAAYLGRQIATYPFVNGRPTSTPDLVYPNVASPMAIGPDGRLYTAEAGTVYIFPPRGTTPERRITFPNRSVCGRGIYATALAVDSHNYLYIGYDSSCGSSKPDVTVPAAGVFVYPPSAHGSPPPAQIIPTDPRGTVSYPLGLTTDGAGNLYEAQLGVKGFLNGVNVYATPETNPTLARQLLLPNRAPNGDVTLDGGELYVAIAFFNRGLPSTFAAAYPSGATGPHRADRRMFPVTEDGQFSSVAIDGNDLFAATSRGQIFELDKLRNGLQRYRQPLSISGVEVRIGP